MGVDAVIQVILPYTPDIDMLAKWSQELDEAVPDFLHFPHDYETVPGPRRAIESMALDGENGPIFGVYAHRLHPPPEGPIGDTIEICTLERYYSGGYPRGRKHVLRAAFNRLIKMFPGGLVYYGPDDGDDLYRWEGKFDE